MNQGRKRHISLAVILLVAGSLHAQDSIPALTEKEAASPDLPEPAVSYSFIKAEENRIHNAVSLSDFFEKLYQRKRGDSARVQIMQIGDSHIQADYLSRRVRQNLQSVFGNAGRGLIFPDRVARTNEPPNFYSSSSFSWESRRIVVPEAALPIGICGITLRTRQPNANLTIKTIDAAPLDYSFNKITLFFQKDISSFHIVVRDSANEDVAFVGAYTYELFPNTSTIRLPFPAHQVTFQMLPATTLQHQATLFGIEVENGKPGLLYHAIGVNGAKFKNYVDASLFAEQTGALNPDLIIFSLGTNEALDYPYVDPQFNTYLETLLKRLKENNPAARFLFTIPPDSFRRKTRRNPGVEVIRAKIIDFAESHNLAYWDLYDVGGGKHSADFWRRSHLLRSDGIHFFVAGYDLQGNLLTSALMNAYDDYVQYRHP